MEKYKEIYVKRIEKLEEAYDAVLDEFSNNVKDKVFKGSLAMLTVMERSRLEVQGLEGRLNADKRSGDESFTIGWLGSSNDDSFTIGSN